MSHKTPRQTLIILHDGDVASVFYVALFGTGEKTYLQYCIRNVFPKLFFLIFILVRRWAGVVMKEISSFQIRGMLSSFRTLEEKYRLKKKRRRRNP